MTISLAVASRNADPARNQVIVMSDSRLSFEDRLGSAKHLDNFIKAMGLGATSAAVAAGRSTPFLMAVEAARPFIAWAEADRAERGLPRFSVWCQAAIVERHLSAIFGEFQHVFAAEDIREVTILVAGFFSDDSPGLVRVQHRAVREGTAEHSYREISIWRPRVGERVYVAAGIPSLARIVAESLRRAEPPAGRGYHDYASVLWDVIKHQGTPTATVGGGLSFGVVKAKERLFEWRPIEIESHVFVRGLRYADTFPKEHRVVIDYDPMLFATLEREDAAAPFAALSSPPSVGIEAHAVQHPTAAAFNVSGDGRLLDMAHQADDAWLLAELDASPH